MKLSKLSTAILFATGASLAHAETTQLNTINVTANHIPMSQHSITANTAVITAEDIAENHYRTLNDALQSIPGITFTRNGGLGTTTSIFMRGQAGNAVLVLVNGIEISDPMGTDSGAILSNLLLSNIERIEILKGPQSGVWGSTASAGVINIITKKVQKGTTGSVNFETGNNNYSKLAVNLASSEEKGDFAVSFSQLSTDGFSAVKAYKSYEQDYEDDAFNQTDFSMNMGINITQKHRIEMLLKKSLNTINYDFASNPNANAGADNESTLRRLQYLYTQNNFSAQIHVSQNEVKLDIPSIFSKNSIINSVGIKGGYTYAQNQSLSFILNNKQYQNILNGDSYYNTGVGLTNTNQFNNNTLILTQSIRSDQYNTFKDRTTGKLGIKNFFQKKIFISANLGTAYNTPSLYQKDFMLTNNLQPEESTAFDISMGAYNVEITYYQSRVKNFIHYNDVAGWPNVYYENLTGISKFEGIEATYSDYLEYANTAVNLTFAQVSAKDNNNEFLRRRAEQTIGLNLMYDGFSRVTIGLNNRYIGNMFDKDNRSGANIGNYYVTDLNLNYALNKQVTLYANVLNLFDTDYTTAVATYQANGVTPKNVYSNGGSQVFVGLQGKF